MRVVIDTNLMLTCISRKSHLHWLFQHLLAKRCELCVTTDILNEYAEIIDRHMGTALADSTLKVILNLSSTLRIDTYYKWNLIRDADDNKFVYCAVAANAMYLISHDRHFDVLKSIPFPKVNVITAESFRAILADAK
ncbi:MAG: putative toxin-antitoxin system toxin component, PIN family [Tunicatimonas sp.]